MLERRNAAPGDCIAFQTSLVWVGLARLAAVDGRGAEVALDGAGKEVREGDARVFDGERLVEEERRRLAGRVDRAGWGGDDGGESIDEQD